MMLDYLVENLETIFLIAGLLAVTAFAAQWIFRKPWH